MSERLSVLIVDDERLARANLAAMLADDPLVHAVHERASVSAARDAVHDVEPDVVLLDIQLGDGSGLDLLRGVDPERLPDVVFVTAHDEYAVEAFELNALDYLLKPVSERRLAASLDRVRQRRRERDLFAYRDRIMRLLSQLPGSMGEGAVRGSAALDRFIIRTGSRRYVVPAESVDWIGGAGNYVRLHTGGTQHLYRGTLNELERQLDRDQFARIHRSTIVNVDRVREVRSRSRGAYTVVLDDGTELRISQRNHTQVNDLLAGRAAR